MNARIVVDRERCVGAGQCVLAAPEVFDSGDDGLVRVVGDTETETGTAVADGIRHAVRLCPARALSLREDG
ncbi:ferredoxin [Streptosporangium sp. NPDC000239]|uniref:Ferredoxin n=1 Tax=Streptosporangium jomthongense TaxID=1193683 RepID=A0ABV8F9S5_9ACTN